MLKIGLTGGIGSGKTTVAKVFETLGIPVYYADDATKRLMNSNNALKALVVQHFGEASYKNGELNRKHIADIVFNNKAVSYTHLRAHETVLDLVCRLLLENKKRQTHKTTNTYT